VTERLGDGGTEAGDRAPAIATASYPSDARLLDELREAWPPAGPATADGRGYATPDLAGREPVAVVRLGDRYAVALVGGVERSFDVVPLVRDEVLSTSWRRAIAGDGLSAFVAGVPVASERAIDADQTNTSVVVGERAIVKWFRRVGPGPSRAATLIAHLDAVGFEAIPRALGAISWRSPSGVDLALAQGDRFLANAVDGWQWIVHRLETHVDHLPDPCPAECDPWVGAPLGRLVRDLHGALATPSPVIATPRVAAQPEEIAEWRQRTRDTLADAVQLTSDGDASAGATLRALEPGMRAAIDRLRPDRAVGAQPVHGDLHVGQVLEWPGGLAVIDFDGNPALDPAANALRQPVERDLAQMLSSLDHVGRVVARGRPAGAETIDRWIVRARREFLAGAGGSPDPILVSAFEIEQECRELVYAARFLPRWRYAPMATLRARFVS
jgi:maltokinase